MTGTIDMLPAVAFLAAAACALLVRRPWPSVLAGAAAGAWLIAPVVPALVFVHRPLALQAVLAAAAMRMSDRRTLALLTVTWVAAVVVPAGRHPLVMLAVGGLVALEAAHRMRQPPGARPSVAALWVLASCWTVTAALRLVADEAWAPEVYSALFTATGVALAWVILAPRWSDEVDSAVELGAGAPEETAARLRSEAASRRDAGAGAGAGAGASLLEAADLLAAHAELTSALIASAEDVRTSRRRLLDTALEEGRRLERVLADGAGQHLSELDETLREIERRLRLDGSAASDALVDLAASCLAEVARTGEEIGQIARGLHSRVLTEHGLAVALEDLATRSAVPVRCRAPADRLPVDVEVAVWYAVAEAVGNAVKHAGATEISIEVEVTGGQATATVEDDGAGGAAVVPGGGLAGLADRVDALGGRLEVQPGRHTGTRVRIQVPL